MGGACRTGGGYAAQFKASRRPDEDPAPEVPATAAAPSNSGAATADSDAVTQIRPRTRTAGRFAAAAASRAAEAGNDGGSATMLALLPPLPLCRSSGCFSDSADAASLQVIAAGDPPPRQPASEPLGMVQGATGAPPAAQPSPAGDMPPGDKPPQSDSSAASAACAGPLVPLPDSGPLQTGSRGPLHLVPSSTAPGQATAAEVAAAICPHVDGAPRRLSFLKRVRASSLCAHCRSERSAVQDDAIGLQHAPSAAFITYEWDVSSCNWPLSQLTRLKMLIVNRRMHMYGYVAVRRRTLWEAARVASTACSAMLCRWSGS